MEVYELAEGRCRYCSEPSVTIVGLDRSRQHLFVQPVCQQCGATGPRASFGTENDTRTLVAQINCAVRGFSTEEE